MGLTKPLDDITQLRIIGDLTTHDQREYLRIRQAKQPRKCRLNLCTRCRILALEETFEQYIKFAHAAATTPLQTR